MSCERSLHLFDDVEVGAIGPYIPHVPKVQPAKRFSILVEEIRGKAVTPASILVRQEAEKLFSAVYDELVEKGGVYNWQDKSYRQGWSEGTFRVIMAVHNALPHLKSSEAASAVKSFMELVADANHWGTKYRQEEECSGRLCAVLERL
jgi:hypothetical protein